MSCATKDASCRSLEPGKYMLTRPGDKPRLIRVFEDEVTTDLWFESKPNRSSESTTKQRIDELAPDVTFHRVGDEVAGIHDFTELDFINEMLRNAAELRQAISIVENQLRDHFAIDPGESSVLADSVMAAVRDGVGSAIELLDLSGRLRR